MECQRPIVIENGSSTCKAGFAGDELPGVVIPSVIARRPRLEPEPDQPSSSRAPINKDYYIGHEAKALQGGYTTKKPVKYGMITNDIDMEKIWEHLIYDQLGVESSDHPFLLTHSTRCFQSRQTKMCQIFFEKLCVPSLHIALNAVLSLHASGRATGIVFNSGTEATEIVPIHEGVAIKRGIGFSHACGQDVTNYLSYRLGKRGYEFLATRPRIHGIDIVDGIKKETAFVYHGRYGSFFYEREKAKEWEFKLPDGQTIRFGDNEVGMSTEGVFSPSVYGLDIPGPFISMLKVVERCSANIRKELSDNVVLSGGNSLLPGFANHLGQGYSEFDSFYGPINIIEPPNREYASWIGGSMIASDPTLNDRWIPKQDYDEVGPSIIQRGFSYFR